MSERITWNKAIVLALMGTLVATACVVSSDDGVDDDDGESGGSSSKGGKSSTGGKSSAGGSTSDGGAATGDGGTATTSAGGTESTGTGGTESTGTGGTGSDVIEYTCDDDGAGGSGGYDAVGTPADDCEPSDSEDACQVCIQENCCDAYKECIGSEPYNVCGWGGPADYQDGAGGEFVCFVECVNENYDPENDVLDDDIENECFAQCATCDGIAGTETLTLAECTVTNCEEDCYY